MHRAQDVFRKTALATAILGLSACGGGGGSGGSSTAPVSTTDPTPVTATGVITGFGSVYVNGVRYDTSSAEVEFEDDSRAKTEDDLRLGMKVVVEGTRSGSARTAERIHYDRDLKGPVDSIAPDPMDPGVGSLLLLGQTVLVDTNTVFDDLADANLDGSVDLRDLAPAPDPVIVEISGFATADGFLATRIERAEATADDSDDDGEVKGLVTALDEAAGTFTLGTLTVSYDATDLDAEDFASAGLAEGMFVEVKGVLLADGTLDATRIEREDDLESGDDDGKEFEIEGILQAVDTAADPDTVTIDGVVIPVSDATRLVGLEGRRVEIEGTFDAAGVLVLRTGSSGVKLEVENVIRVEDRVTTVGADSFTTRLGVVVAPTGTSRVEDDGSEDGDRLTPAAFLTRLQPGDFVEARGYPSADGSITWTRVERKDEDDVGCSLRGPFEDGSSADPTFAILDVTVDTSGISSDDDFRDGDLAIGREAFFAALTAGAIVKATSETSETACSDGLLLAREVEFEHDDGVYGSSDDDGDDSGTSEDDSGSSED